MTTGSSEEDLTVGMENKGGEARSGRTLKATRRSLYFIVIMRNHRKVWREGECGVDCREGQEAVESRAGDQLVDCCSNCSQKWCK
jgi:hypothetical protein